MAYDELARFVPGQGGLQYYPVSDDVHKAWQEQQDKLSYEAYLKQEAEKKKEIHQEFIKINKELKQKEAQRKLDEF